MDQAPSTKNTGKTIQRALLLFCFILLGYFFYQKQLEAPHNFSSSEKRVILSDGGLDFSFSFVTASTVGELLVALKLTLQEGDSIFPALESELFSGTHIYITRAHTLSVRIDGNTRTLRTQATTVAEALMTAGITLDADDMVKPDRDALVTEGLVATVTRVQIEEQTNDKVIAFSKKENEDATLSWRKNVVTQKGENGIERRIYRVSFYDGKEVNRKLLNTEIIKEPVPEIVTQGTYVQVGKKHTGAASWYAFTGTLSAANPWLPIGSYVRVTNKENGKSVIVRINDRGPFAPGRIIDLDKVAFAKIASLGAGVVNVTMEEIVN